MDKPHDAGGSFVSRHETDGQHSEADLQPGTQPRDVGLGIDIALVDVADIERGGGIERGVVARHDGTKHRGGESAHQPRRQQLTDDMSVGRVAEVAVELVGADAGDDDDRRDDQQADDHRGIDALLRLLDRRRRECALGDGLVGTPIVELGKNHAGQQSRPRDGRIRSADEREALGGNAGEIPVDGVERKESDEQGHAEDDDAVVGIGDRDSPEPTENRIRGTDRRGAAGDHDERHVELEHGSDHERTRVEHDRQKDQNVAQQENGRDGRTDVFVVIAALKQLGDGRAFVFVVDGDENFREEDEADDGGELPENEQQHLAAVHADERIGVEVGERDRPGDENPGEPAIREEVFLGVVGRANRLAAMPPGDEGDKQVQAEKDSELDNGGVGHGWGRKAVGRICAIARGSTTLDSGKLRRQGRSSGQLH